MILESGQDSVTVSVWAEDIKTIIEFKRFIGNMPISREERMREGRESFRPGCKSSLLGREREMCRTEEKEPQTAEQF